jgi:hypothetical protein
MRFLMAVVSVLRLVDDNRGSLLVPVEGHGHFLAALAVADNALQRDHRTPCRAGTGSSRPREAAGVEGIGLERRQRAFHGQAAPGRVQVGDVVDHLRPGRFREIGAGRGIGLALEQACNADL